MPLYVPLISFLYKGFPFQQDLVKGLDFIFLRGIL